MTQEEMFGKMTQNFMALMERSIKAQEVANQLKAIEIEMYEYYHCGELDDAYKFGGKAAKLLK